MREIVAAKGGSVRSCDTNATSISDRIPVIVKCRRYHQWKTSLGQLLGQRWCQRCWFTDRKAVLEGEMDLATYHSFYGTAGNPESRVTIDDVRRLASELGLTLLSECYVSAKKKLKFRCGKCAEKTFDVNYSNLVQKRPKACPKCSRAAAGVKRRHTLADLQKLAAKKKGFLLSSAYHGVFAPMTWWCGQCEDVFPRKRTADDIIQGGWCQRCSRKLGASRRTATVRQKRTERRLSKITSLLERKRWKVAGGLQKSVETNGPVSLVCAHGKPFQRSVSSLVSASVQCECDRINSTTNSHQKLLKVLRRLGWELCSEYKNSKEAVRVRCQHGKEFARNVGGIDSTSKCECRKRASSGYKYISQRDSGRYSVNIVIDYEAKYLGTYDSVKEAVAARNAYCRKKGKIIVE